MNERDLKNIIDDIEESVTRLTNSIDDLRRDMHEVNRKLVDLQSAVRLEHQAMREDCNELFRRIGNIESDNFPRDSSEIMKDIALERYMEVDRVPGWEAA